MEVQVCLNTQAKVKENGQSSAIRTQTFKITDDITYVKVS